MTPERKTDAKALGLSVARARNKIRGTRAKLARVNGLLSNRRISRDGKIRLTKVRILLQGSLRIGRNALSQKTSRVASPRGKKSRLINPRPYAHSQSLRLFP